MPLCETCLFLLKVLWDFFISLLRAWWALCIGRFLSALSSGKRLALFRAGSHSLRIVRSSVVSWVTCPLPGPLLKAERSSWKGLFFLCDSLSLRRVPHAVGTCNTAEWQVSVAGNCVGEELGPGNGRCPLRGTKWERSWGLGG